MCLIRAIFTWQGKPCLSCIVVLHNWILIFMMMMLFMLLLLLMMFVVVVVVTCHASCFFSIIVDMCGRDSDGAEPCFNLVNSLQQHVFRFLGGQRDALLKHVDVVSDFYRVVRAAVQFPCCCFWDNAIAAAAVLLLL